MRLDLHIHTSRYSRGCSILDPRAMIRRAVELGLDGVVVTEHDSLWGKAEIEALRRQAPGLVVLRGKEIIVHDWHVLLLNFSELLPRGLTPAEICGLVRGAGGATILAHPFRYGRRMNLGSDELAGLLLPFDALEALTAQHRPEENEFASRIAVELGLTTTGASDAHDLQTIGRFVTEFEDPITSESALATALRAGRCRPAVGPAT